MPHALVTGASRGIGRGIALELALAGHQVYITGRNEKTLNLVQKDFESLKISQKYSNQNGSIKPLVCDHAIDAEVDKLFGKIEKLDILINNAYSAVESIGNAGESGFHQIGIEFYDDVNHVGLRNHYRCSHHAVQKMFKAENSKFAKALIVNISSFGGCQYLFNAAYGIGKEAKDRMMADMAIDLKKSRSKNSSERAIYCFSLWPGAVLTETIQGILENNRGKTDPKSVQMKNLFQNGESTRFSGRVLAKVIDNLDNPKFVKSINGKIATTPDLAREFNIKDIDNRVIISSFSIKNVLMISGHESLAGWVPAWVLIPKWLITLNSFGRRFR